MSGFIYAYVERDIGQNANVTCKMSYANLAVQCTVWNCEMIILASQSENPDLLSFLISPELPLRKPGLAVRLRAGGLTRLFEFALD
jgi:hypothetical protein